MSSTDNHGRRRLVSPARVLTVLQDELSRQQAPPTLREISEELGVSRRTVQRYLKDLEDRGWIRRWKRGRGVEITVDKEHAILSRIFGEP